MSVDRLAACRARLDGIAEQSFEDRAETLEFVHESLTAELDELLRRDHATDDSGRFRLEGRAPAPELARTYHQRRLPLRSAARSLRRGCLHRESADIDNRMSSLRHR